MTNYQTQRQVINLAKRLISFRTTADRPDELLACTDFIRNFFKDANLTVRRFTKNSKPSLLITPSKEAQPKLLFLGHFDVVPGPAGIFTPQLQGNRLYGRGALDMKATVAVLTVTMAQLVQKNTKSSVGLLLTGDEEIGGFDGTSYLIEKLKLRPKFVIASEPTWLKIGNAAKGIIRLKLIAKGKSAHAAKPWEGKNAIVALAEALAKLQDAFSPPPRPTAKTTINISTVAGGDALNKVPDFAQAQLDIRLAPPDPPEKIVRRIRELCPEVMVEVTAMEPAAFCAPANQLVISLLNSIKKTTGKAGELITKEAASDVRFFTTKGIPGVVFGPGGGGSHAENEWVDLKSLFTFYEILEGFVPASINPPKR